MSGWLLQIFQDNSFFQNSQNETNQVHGMSNSKRLDQVSGGYRWLCDEQRNFIRNNSGNVIEQGPIV